MPPYLATIERWAKAEAFEMGYKQGYRDGLQECIALTLEARFGNGGRRAAARVNRIKDNGVLGVVLEAVCTGQSLVGVRKCLREVEYTS